MKDDIIVMGKIVSTHGVRGSFKIVIYSQCERDFFSYKNHFEIEKKFIDIKKKFKKENVLICESSTVKNKEEALDLVGKFITINQKHLKKNTSEDYFHKDLLGCKVFDKYGKNLGKIKAIHNFGAGDLLELDSGYPFMIRFADIKKSDINLKKKIIIINNLND